MSIYDTSSSSTTEQSLSMLNGSFLWFRLLIETLLRIPHTEDDRLELVKLLKDTYAGNVSQLHIIQEFELGYTSQRALWWYTRDSCVYKMLNKALRCHDHDTLISFRTFITDIYSELKHLQENEKDVSVTRVYRGQLISAVELQRLKSSIGQYVSMNSFISTTLDRSVAVFYITSSMASVANHLRPVLLDIEINKSLEDVKPYGNISSQSHFTEEKEILFMVGSIFKIQSIVEPKSDRMWTIKLSLCSENDHELKELASYLQMEMLKYNPSMISLGNMLREMCEYKEATKCFQRQLNQLQDENSSEAACCYTSLGDVARAIGNYDLSITYHKKALEIHSNVPNDDQPISFAYNKLGAAFRQKKQYEEALEVYQKCLQIEQSKLDGNPEGEEIATTYYNMGILYEEQDKFNEAMKYYNQSLMIRKKYLPPNHYKIARLYRGMGETYYYHKDYALALEYLQKSLEMSMKSRTETHYDLGLLFHHIGRVYEDTEKLDLALKNYVEADKIYRHALLSTHEWLIENQQHIDSVSAKLK
jgi:tetratricopeptide (TPR) repeat protein